MLTMWALVTNVHFVRLPSYSSSFRASAGDKAVTLPCRATITVFSPCSVRKNAFAKPRTSVTGRQCLLQMSRLVLERPTPGQSLLPTVLVLTPLHDALAWGKGRHAG